MLISVHAAFAVALLLIVRAQAGNLFINAGGPGEACTEFRTDTGLYVTGPSQTFISPRSKLATGGWIKLYDSHRWAPQPGDLVYSIPVPAGSYSVYLLFMETWTGATVGVRQFTIAINGVLVTQQGINGAPLDLFGRVGLDKPFFVNAGPRAAVDGKITITFGRVAGKNNPMVSGIGIIGANADALVGTEGVVPCGSSPAPTVIATPTVALTALPTTSAGVSTIPTPSISGTTLPTPTAGATAAPTAAPTPSVSPSVGSCPGGVTSTDVKGFHLAHSVSGGPYVETDFNEDNVAAVALDGLRSHSHYSEGTEIGQIVLYLWSWTENGIEKTATGPQPTVNFPVGITTLKLFVQDQKCNTAEETTTVTVNTATKEGAYCYYYDLGESAPTTVPLPQSLQAAPKPQFATNVGDINFGTTASFGTFPFNQNSFAVRCTFSVNVVTTSTISYKLIHNGPVKLYSNDVLVGSSDSTAVNTMTETAPKLFTAGLQQWQILYLRTATVEGQLKFQFANGGIIPQVTVRHDAGSTLPVITGVSKTNGLSGDFISVFGLAFVNGVKVKFGTVEATPFESDAGAIQMRVPEGVEGSTVEITVETAAGISNGIPFTYITNVFVCPVINFTEDSIKTSTGVELEIPDIAVLRYGPDGRLYLGSQKSEILVLALDKDLQVTQTCTKNIANGGPRRWVLGIAFNPKTTNLKMYFTSNTFNWQKFGLIPDFVTGWTNGKVQSVTLSSPTSCFNNDVTDVVTGLPVSNHDHGNNFIQFLPTGQMVIGVGGFTNGGISIPSDALGGIPPNPYSGAIVECPETGANIVYSNPLQPDQSTATGGCSVYAPGLRNTFASELHTNGFLYATDNGPNQGFGAFSTDCNGGQVAAKNIPDKLFKVVPGQCHGHPHLPRAQLNPAECILEDPSCVQPLLSNLQSSTNGVLEYRSNIFNGSLKEDLLLAKFSDTAGKPGRITRVKLNENGNILSPDGVINIFHPDSGLSIVEGPRGEIIMSRVFKKSFFVLKPVCPKPTTLTYLISVHPRRGPAAGGHKVLITGYNFGTTPTALFGTSPCTDVVSIDDDNFTCVTPPNVANMQVKVIVTGSLGENIPTNGPDYWYW